MGYGEKLTTISTGFHLNAHVLLSAFRMPDSKWLHINERKRAEIARLGPTPPGRWITATKTGRTGMPGEFSYL